MHPGTTSLKSDQWYLEYNANEDQWRLHTPGYTPEVSCRVALRDNQIIIGWHQKSTIPAGVREILDRSLRQIHWDEIFDRQITIISINSQQVCTAARAVEALRKIRNI